jgi:hypothetical protein
MNRIARRPPLILLLLGSLAWTACAPKQEESTIRTPERVESESMGIAVADLPADFEVVSNQGPVLELRTVGDSAGGTLVIEVTEELAGGLDLVAAAEAMQEWFEQQPDGQYFGNLELGTPTGPAFTSRGSYRSDQGEVEELRVFALHPSENRMVRMTFSYPPGEGKIRMQQLVSVLGEIEGR